MGPFVLNAGFWNPTLPAREVATVDALTGGRLELGLGTGYVKAEFDLAGLPWESAGRRVTCLARTVEELGPLPAVPPSAGRARRPDAGTGRTARRVVAFTGAVRPPGSADGALRLVSAEAMDRGHRRPAGFRGAVARRPRSAT